ncbi:MAG: hypothetical protein L6265_11480, partial [Thermoplasmatales archaeon]|nr:hypothetical protein [Thermoplasmatales archaeon]
MNSKKEESEGDISLEEFFKKQLSPCFEETKRQRNLDELVGHCRYSNSLLDILSKMSKEMPMGKLSNCFIYMKLFELIKQLTFWVLHICCGAYHNAIRNMRYSIEAILRAYYI